MNEHQRRVIGRVVDEIQLYRDGNQSMLQLLNRCWGLYEAAQLRDSDRDRFFDAYYFLSDADDANQPWMPSGQGSDEAVQAALAKFEEYGRAVRDAGPRYDPPGDIPGH